MCVCERETEREREKNVVMGARKKDYAVFTPSCGRAKPESSDAWGGKETLLVSTPSAGLGHGDRREGQTVRSDGAPHCTPYPEGGDKRELVVSTPSSGLFAL